MEIIRGKCASSLDASSLRPGLAVYDAVHLDIGTGDGRYAQHIARTYPRHFAIGLDACRENLREASRRAPANALFIIANACALPPELAGAAAYITVNFPWGSLLAGLLDEDSTLLNGLRAIARPNTRLDLRLNAGALAQAGWSLEGGAARVRALLTAAGFDTQPPLSLTAPDLQAFPTTWAKRLAFGRAPRAIHLSAVKRADARLELHSPQGTPST